MSNFPQSNTFSDRDDEIDLFELAKNLWSQKLLIILVTMVVTAAAAAYAYFSSPVYEVSAHLLAPRSSDIAGYNLGRAEAGLVALDVPNVYASYLTSLASETLRRSFFREIYLPSQSEGKKAGAQDRLWEDFNRTVTLKPPSEKNKFESFEVIFQHENPQVAEKWLGEFVRRSAAQTKAEIQRDEMQEVNLKALGIERTIDSLRVTALKQRQDRIARLQEALKVAMAVGKKAPEVTAGRTSSDGELTGFVDGSLMYMRGANAIRAELDILQARKSDDPFIAELRGLQASLAFLKAIDSKPDNVAVVTVDSMDEVPETPIKPKKALIIALGVVLGGMLGVFIALVRSMLRKRREAAVV